MYSAYSKSRDIEDITKTKIELLKLKTTMTETKNIPGGINSRLDMAEEKIREPECTGIETIQNETQTEKELEKPNKAKIASMNSGTTSSSLAYM